jgi:coproporphyrinogen III oxidase
MSERDEQQRAADDWFRDLRDRICGAFEAIEREAGSDAAFERTAWERPGGGGGVMSKMAGRVFEKVGVNISTVWGQFEPEFAKSVNGAAEDPRFTATGISLVAHMANPHVPAVHMNTRFLTTTKRWFGGGADLNPPIPREADTADFHAAFRAACDRHSPDYWPRFSAWCDEYFFIKHRGVSRGVGGIFYDHLDSGDWAADFAFTRNVGETFLSIYPELVRRRMNEPWDEADRQQQLRYRGLYAEFNLVWDRGTLFGLKTNGNIDAILMSLPPLAAWE